MKLWKNIKESIATRPEPGKSGAGTLDFRDWSQTQAYELDVFKSQTSISTDSGLCTERTPRRTLVELEKPPGTTFGIQLASRSEPGVVPSIVSLSPESVAAESDRFAPGDRLCSVNGIATSRLSNDELLRLLDNVEERASLEVEYYMPNYVSSQSSLYITSKVAEVAVERAGGPLGVTLRGGAGERPAALVVAHVRPGGAAYATSRIKVGDRLLKVDHISLLNKTLSEVHQILQNSPHVTSLTIEYDVSIMESVKLATGPLLVEIERPCNEDLGLFLTNQRYSEDCYSTGSETYQRPGCFGGVYIDSILPASISDRCGALHPGDQLLAFDDLVIENNNYTAEEVMCYLENCSNRGFTQLHIAPRHILQKNGRYTREHSMSGTSTLNTRKQRQNRGLRQSSVPKLHDEFDCQQNYLSGVGVCRTDVLTVQLDIAPNQDSGISVFEDNSALLIAHITHQSPAYRSGCLQARDRILCINGHDSLTAAVANDILQRRNESHSMKYINLKVEFTMANNIEASSGVFNVKLATNSAGLGVTITGSKQRGISSDEPMVISDIKTGSVAHRSGALAVGYQLLAINGQPLHNLSLDTAFNILQNSPDDIITLKIRKIDNSEDWSDVRPKPTQQTASKSYNLETTALVHYGHNVATNTKPEQSGSAQGSVKNESGGADERLGTSIFTVELKKQENGPLGLTIAGSEDVTQPILLSGLVEGGVAEKSGKLKIGDEILSINGESVLSKPLSEAIKLLQNNNQHVLLKISRKVTGALEINKEEHLSWPRDSNLCSNHSNSSPGLSNDSAVESWDQNTPVKSSDNMANNDSTIEYAVPDKTRQNPDVQFGQEATYSSTDEDKLLASGYKPVVTPYCVNQLPLPNYSLNNSLKSFHYDNKCLSSINTLRNKPPNGLPDDDSNRIEIFSSNSREIADKLRGYKCDYVPMVPYGINVPSPRTPTRRNWEGEKFNFNIDVNGYGHTITQKPPIAMPSTSYQMTGSDNEMPGLYNTESITPTRGSVHHVILYKDAIYDDYGFSVSDGLYERGVYINRIRKGGPADIVGLLRPYDRILQVNGTRTVDYDCCMTVPLIASAGDRLEIVIHRLKESHPRDDDDSSQSDSNIVTKTI